MFRNGIHYTSRLKIRKSDNFSSRSKRKGRLYALRGTARRKFYVSLQYGYKNRKRI